MCELLVRGLFVGLVRPETLRAGLIVQRSSKNREAKALKLGELIAVACECKSLIKSARIGKKTGIPNSLLSQIETGHVKEPSWRNVVKIAKILGLKLDRLARSMERRGPGPTQGKGSRRFLQRSLHRQHLPRLPASGDNAQDRLEVEEENEEFAAR
jgi:transcriptional regulator with XRE-family HTH domain